MAIEAAIWFHDVVYQPEASDNEQCSARWAIDVMKEGGLASGLIKLVERLILATDHRRSAETDAEKWTCDIDLSILGQPESVYEEYAKAIRREYHFVPESRYREGRIAVLRSFLDRKAIYATRFFHDRYESLARSNLRREVSRWTDGIETGSA